jgi:hypothetical protein
MQVPGLCNCWLLRLTDEMVSSAMRSEIFLVGEHRLLQWLAVMTSDEIDLINCRDGDLIW